MQFYLFAGPAGLCSKCIFSFPISSDAENAISWLDRLVAAPRTSLPVAVATPEIWIRKRTRTLTSRSHQVVEFFRVISIFYSFFFCSGRFGTLFACWRNGPIDGVGGGPFFERARRPSLPWRRSCLAAGEWSNQEPSLFGEKSRATNRVTIGPRLFCDRWHGIINEDCGGWWRTKMADVPGLAFDVDASDRPVLELKRMASLAFSHGTHLVAVDWFRFYSGGELHGIQRVANWTAPPGGNFSAQRCRRLVSAYGLIKAHFWPLELGKI